MLPDRVSNPEPLTYESGALPIALRGPVILYVSSMLRQRVLGWGNSLGLENGIIGRIIRHSVSRS